MSSFKALMQQAEKNQYEYEKQHLKKINKQLEQDERRKRIENEKIKKKEEAFSQFKKIAKSLPNDLQKNNDKVERNHSSDRNSKNESSINKNIHEKNAVFHTKIKKISNPNTQSNSNHTATKLEYRKKPNSSFSQSKKHLSFKDLMEKAKHNDISKPVVNNSSDDFREAKKALKNQAGRKKYRDDYDDSSADERYNSKKKSNKKESNNKSEVKKSKKELLNEQKEKRKREKERNLKAYDGSKDRVAQERLNILKSRGIYTPATSKISQEVTEMVKRMEYNKKNGINNNANNSLNNSSKDNIHRSSSILEHHKPKMKINSRYDSSDSGHSRKHSRYEDESDDYDSEYERRQRLLENKKRVKKVKGTYGDYEVYDEDYVNNNVSSIIGNIFGYNRNRYRDEEDIDDMEVGYSDVKREEARSLRIAKREDEKEEELERQRLERLKRRRRD